MPRINRYTTEFDVNGTPYRAVFTHEHFEPPLMWEGKFKTLHIRHVTLCDLHNVQDNSTNTGMARCSHLDTYNWTRGIKVALSRALDKRGITGKAQNPFFAGFFRE